MRIQPSCEDLLELTKLNPFDHFLDERPRVPDELLERMKLVTTEEAWAVLRNHGYHRQFEGLVSEQSLYDLNTRTIELEVIPACRVYGLGLIPWSPLAGALLGGALQKAAEGHRADKRT